MSIKAIEIRVIGPTGSGKSHVMETIEHALRDTYGPHTMVASHELSLERNLGSPGAKPSVKNTVFVITEQNEARQ